MSEAVDDDPFRLKCSAGGRHEWEQTYVPDDTGGPLPAHVCVKCEEVDLDEHPLD